MQNLLDIYFRDRFLKGNEEKIFNDFQMLALHSIHLALIALNAFEQHLHFFNFYFLVNF